MNRITRTFAQLNESGKKAFVAYVAEHLTIFLPLTQETPTTR